MCSEGSNSSNSELLKKWVLATRRQHFKPTCASKLCSDHFKDTDYNGMPRESRLLDDVVPSVFSFPSQLQVII